MARTLNTRCLDFAVRRLFLAEPDEGFVVTSLSARQLASEYCEKEGCSRPCRKHSQAMMLGLSKGIVDGDIHAEMSLRGVVFVRLSPKGVLSPSAWSSRPNWFDDRPKLVEWARERV